MYRIKTDKLTLSLEIVRVSSLFRHEKIIPRVANRLILEFKNFASLQNPVIIDENRVVLDGNHRIYVFKKLNIKFIPVCIIDYLDDSTKIRCWYRRFGNIRQIGSVKKAFKSSGCLLMPMTDREEFIRSFEADSFACGIQQGNDFTYIKFPDTMSEDIVAAYDLLQRIQDELTAQGISIAYIPCNTVQKDHSSEEMKPDEAVLWTPRLSKMAVISFAKQQRIFPPKTTRHIIPIRPLNVNVPGHWLKESISLEEINQRFVEFLKTKKMRRFGPGQVIDGRYYEEELLVFFKSHERF